MLKPSTSNPPEKRGPKEDAEHLGRLEHFRAELAADYAPGLSRWDAHAWPAICAAAGRPTLATKLRRWWNGEKKAGTGWPIRPSRDDYDQLCKFLPWYTPPAGSTTPE